MPVTPILLSNLIANFTSTSIVGVNSGVLAQAIAQAIGTWSAVPGNITLNGVTAGVAGGGVVTGKITLVPNPVFYENAFVSSGLVGLQKSALCVSLSNAVATAFSSAIYVGSSGGVGIGTDVSKITFVNTSSLITILNSTFASLTIVGLNSSVLATAISTGVSAHLLTGVGNGVVAGSPSPIPSVGSSICNVVI